MFPGSCEAVEKAIMLDRLKINAPVHSANWDMPEQLIALEAHKANMTIFTEDLYNGALEAHKALWSGQATHVDPLDLGNDLQLSNIRVGELRDSGARIGADEALTYFLSWYEKVDLNTLRSMRKGSMWTTNPELIWRCQELAHSYMDFAQTDTFVRDIREPVKDADTDDAEGSDSSQDEEETEDGGNARADALEEHSTPAGGRASVPSAGSSTPDADVSTATTPSAGGSASAPAS
jgi:hypothetical protein